MVDEEKLKELRSKYARENRKGNPGKAYEAVREARKLKGELEEEEEEDSGSDLESFEALNGVGPELAEELVEAFGDVDSLADASKEELADVSGVGDKRAEGLLEQV